jgi:hypothetical protein
LPDVGIEPGHLLPNDNEAFVTDQLQLPVSRPWWALVIAALLLAAAGWLLATAGTGQTQPGATDDAPPMLAVAPGGRVELAALPAEHQELYRAAAADPDVFEAVACYCGCEAFLDHRHLLDCFVREDGGWERHATGCAVCLAEAREVIELRSAGTPIDEIARRIDDRYGAITDPAT